MPRRQQLQGGDDRYSNKATYWWLWNKGSDKCSDKGSEEDVLTELSCQWLQDKGSEEDVLTELSRRWLQDKGSDEGSEKDALMKLSQW